MLYNLSVVCGRFQPIHCGHVDIIRKALTLSDKVGLYIGSCNNTGTVTNPFTFEERYQFIYDIFKQEIDSGRLIVKPLYDREHPADDLSWGKYYLDCIHRDFGIPDLFVYGNDKERNKWFTEEDLVGIDTLVVNRKNIKISATEIRNNINDIEYFKANIPVEIADKYETIKNKIIEVSRYV